ncbi:MAG: DUF1232 domain-containing protein [Deltaproteobacteria bacterium]|nr:DUF1232 domain-containing protein [Deltaproteobacteria bacterium]
MFEQHRNLYQLIEEVADRIEALDPGPGADRDAFAKQLLEARQDLFAQLEGGADGEASRRASAALASCMLGLIKDIPVIAEAMLHAIDRRSAEPAVRCALAGALAYLVRLKDLLPDDLPGGFGYIDDCVILRATATEFLDFLPSGFTTADQERRVLELLAICVPPARIPEFQAAVEEIWLTFHVLLWESEEIAEELGNQLLEDPLDTPLPQPQRESIPLPPGPRLSMAPGEESLSVKSGHIAIDFAKGGTVLVDENGEITQWE